MAYCEAGCLMGDPANQCNGNVCLVAAARQGDERARDRLFTLLAPFVERHARKVCGEAGMAQDIAQASLLRVLERLPQLRRPERLAAWARRIVTNEFRMEERGRALRRQAPLTADVDTPESEAERRLDARRELGHVLEAAPQLPPLLEQTFRMRVVEGLSTRQTAERLGVSVEAVRARLARARKRLRPVRRRSNSKETA
jgi:RNA polymerase sigma-70 factor (ECF subfamily)